MISAYVSRLVILVFGTLYPAYASYKAVRTKNVKEYVKWMMYWIVFALFSCAETFTDVFFSWFPFYYEIKIILVVWLLSPATKGSSILYRKFVHPMLSRREQEIDEYISKAKEQGYHTVLNLGTKGVNYATTVIMQTAIKGGGGLVNQLRKSYSLSDLSTDISHPSDDRIRQNGRDEPDDVVETSEPRLRRPRGRNYSPHRSVSGPNRVDMYFPEVDVDVRQSHASSTSSARGETLTHIRSIEDVSSGYSSAEYVAHSVKSEGVVREGSLVRTASVGGASRVRVKTTRSSGLSTKKVATPTEDSSLLEENEEPEYDTQLISKSSIHVLRKQNALAFAPNVAMIEIIHQVEGNDEPLSTSSNDNDSSNDFDDPMDFPSEKDKTLEEVSCEKDELILKENIDNKDVRNDGMGEISPEFVETTTDVNISYSNETSKAVDDNLDKNSEGSFVSVKSLTDTNNLSRSEQKDSERAGKYNKLAAPLPPTQKKLDNDDKVAIVNDVCDSGMNEKNSSTNSDTTEIPSLDHKCEPGIDSKSESDPKIEEDKGKPIKATLVLTPGILKSVEIPSDSSRKSKIFVSASPKAQRKKKTENQKTKKTPISRLMMLPKKLTFWNHSSNKSDENATAILAETSSLLSDDQIRKLEIAIKRSSWHENSSSRSVTPESIDIKYSRSNEELTRIPANPKFTDNFGHVSRRNDNSLDEMKLRELSQSPVRIGKHTEV